MVVQRKAHNLSSLLREKERQTFLNKTLSSALLLSLRNRMCVCVHQEDGLLFIL